MFANIYEPNYLQEPSRRSGGALFTSYHASSRCSVSWGETPGLMGKSKKKLKAGQINVLRQQYDAFLEEDKKRKERNGDILEKLDKMRFSNAVARYKTNIYLDPRVSFNCTEEAPLTSYSHPQMNSPPTVGPIRISQESPMLDVVAKPMDERCIINEISKKYILIPKIRSIIPEQYIPKAIKPDNNNDSDWKSKYSILDKLKQNEKEDTTSFSVYKDHGKSFIDDIPTKEHKYRVEDEALVSKHGFADIKTDPIKHSFNSPDQGKANNVIIDDTKGNARVPKTEREQTGITKDIETLSSTDEGYRQLKPDKGSADFERSIRKDVSHISGYESVKFKNTEDQNNAAYNDKHEHEDNEKLSPIVDDIRHVEEIEALKPTAQTNIENHNTGDSEKLKYPIDVINVQDFTPGQGVTLVDGVNINPEGRDVTQPYLTSSEQYEAPVSQQPVGDQYVTQPKASSEQAYLPGDDQAPSGGHYVEPTAAVEQVNLQGANQLPSGGHYVEPTAAVEQVYLPGENQLPSGDQYTSESVAASSEQQEFTEQQQQESSYDPVTGDVTSEIQEFEDEQNQMFYTEQTNYQYNQDPNAVGDVYNPDAHYDPAMYYGGVQQEAAYPVEIDEHEETSQRYDPVYEEQYASKGAEQPQYAEPQQYDQQQYSEQQYGDQQQYSEQQYGDQQQYDEKYVEQQFYGEQQYSDQQPYAEEQYAEQPYAEQQAEQQGDSNIIATLEEHEPGLSERLHEKQTVEQIEQQLNNEEFGEPNQEAPLVGDIVDESILYAQNPDDTAAAEQCVENQNPQPI